MSLTQGLLADAASGDSSATPRLVLTFVLSGLWAWRGFVRAERIERETGYRPWGWSPTGWSVMCFCTSLLGRLLLETAASRAKKKQEAACRPSSAPVFAQPTGYGPVALRTQPTSQEPVPLQTQPSSYVPVPLRTQPTSNGIAPEPYITGAVPPAYVTAPACRDILPGR